MRTNITGFIRASIASCTLVSTLPAQAAAVRSADQAADRVYAQGFGLVSRTDKASDAWEVWASKDSIAYRISVDAESGLVVAAIPAQDND